MRVKERGREEGKGGFLSRSTTASDLTSVRGEMEMEMHEQRQRLKTLTLRLPLRYCTHSVNVALSELVAQESDSGLEGLGLELQLYGFLDPYTRGDTHSRDVEALLAAVGGGVGKGEKRWQRREHWGSCGREVSAVLECGRSGGEARRMGKGGERAYNIPQKLRVGGTKEDGDALEGVDGGCVAERKDVDVGFLWK